MVDAIKMRYLMVEKITLTGDAIESSYIWLDRDYLRSLSEILHTREVATGTGFPVLDKAFLAQEIAHEHF
jgi:hypothetical protein